MFFFQPKCFCGSKRQHLTQGLRESSTMDSGHYRKELGTLSNGNIPWRGEVMRSLLYEWERRGRLTPKCGLDGMDDQITVTTILESI